MTLLELYAAAAGAIFVAVTLLWLFSLVLRNASIIDIFWGFGFVLCNWLTLMLAEGDVSARQWLLHAAVTLWGLRLSMHLLARNAGRGEDFRYRRWRAAGGSHWWLTSYYRVFLLQGALLLLIAAPVIVVNADPQQPALGWLDFLGLVVWLTGFAIEVVSDQQLALFKADPENKEQVMDRGLWRYSVHPNYFGDAVQWWGIWLIAASAPGGVWTFVGPLLMTVIFLRVSNGVLERALARRRPAYAAYLERTNRFFPGPPRRGGVQGDL